MQLATVIKILNTEIRKINNLKVVSNISALQIFPYKQHPTSDCEIAWKQGIKKKRFVVVVFYILFLISEVHVSNFLK